MSTDARPSDALPIIHSLWIGPTLSRLELLTLHSFVAWGHEFHLWLYDPLKTPVPDGVLLRDASEILPPERIFRKRKVDAETGVGQGSVSPFSDLFRYKLLHQYGGIWVDMDVTCLRPFDFQAPYVFRAHRLGMIGNVLKCPRGCELMRTCYEQGELIANEHADWLDLVRILNDNVQRLGLAAFIRDDISNRDSWHDSIRQFLESDTPIPNDWYAIHWMSEFLKTVAKDNGYYQGQKLAGAIPDKDNPLPGTTLHQLYSSYGLLGPRMGDTGTRTLGRSRVAPSSKGGIEPKARSKAAEFNILVPALVRGGAERTIVETVRALSGRTDVDVSVFAMSEASKNYGVPSYDNVMIRVFDGDWSKVTFQKIAESVCKSHRRLIFTHLIGARHLENLWSLGVKTVPVVHNARAGWLDPAPAYNHPQVPFIVAVADVVAEQLSELGCARPIVTIRHELQRWFTPADMAGSRQQIRDAYGIRADVLLIGMVGQFKSQKAYTRAVRVLAGVVRHRKARLMILGDWDHDYGSGRATYEATCRLALELRVIADLITPGNVHPVDAYLAAFDVFLNTSVYEGLSIALLEAAQAGCPIVAADAGGNREAVPEGGVIIEDPSDIDAYVRAILGSSLAAERHPPDQPCTPDLIPRLWALLAKHGAQPSDAPARAGALIVACGLSAGRGANVLLKALSCVPDARRTLCVFGGDIDANLRAQAARAGVSTVDVSGGADFLDLADSIIGRLDALHLRSVYFWNLDAPIKLLVAKLLSARDVRIFDINHNPSLIEDSAANLSLQRRLAFNADAYRSRLAALKPVQVEAFRGVVRSEQIGPGAKI